jgi:GNAT superfamily N-acetyltransferase
MEVDDIPVGLRLCRHAQWNQVASDWELFLKLSPDGCRVAVEDKVIGTVTTLNYENRFSWISMVLVDPEFQRKGIGTTLLYEALNLLQDQETIKLDASPAGRNLYLKLNFTEEYPLVRMTRNKVEMSIKTHPSRAMDINDLTRISQYDAAVFGAARLDLLQWLYEGSSPFGFISEAGNEISGFCLGRKGEHYFHIGPVVSENIETAKDLVTAALNQLIGHPVMLDIPLFDLNWKDWLISLGFEEQRPFYRMYRGLNRFPGIPEKQYAIAGPEFG